MDFKALEIAVKKLKNGDQSAFNTIYNMTKTRVYYTILTIVKDPQSAEDIMQDTYLRMLDKLDYYKKSNGFITWLQMMAKNLAINAYHKKSKTVSVDVNDNAQLFGQTNTNQENRYYLQELLKTLNENEKEVVIRHVVLEEKHKDIAKAMNKPLGTITWMYQNALKKLRNDGGDKDE